MAQFGCAMRWRSSSQFSVLSSQFSVLSSQFSVLSSQFSVLSSQLSVHVAQLALPQNDSHTCFVSKKRHEDLRLRAFVVLLQPYFARPATTGVAENGPKSSARAMAEMGADAATVTEPTKLPFGNA